MGRQPSSKHQPRPGTREVGSRRIYIEALEARTLFSGGHDVLRAQLETFSAHGPQLNIRFDASQGNDELHTPHALGLVGPALTASQDSQGSAYATPAFGLFARFTEVRGPDAAGGVHSLGFANLPVIEIVYLQEPGGSGQIVVTGSSVSAVDAASGGGDSSDLNTLIQLAVPTQSENGKLSHSIDRKLAGGSLGKNDFDTGDSIPPGTLPPGYGLKQVLIPNGQTKTIVVAANQDSGQGAVSATGSSSNSPPANTTPPQFNPAATAPTPPSAAQLTPLAQAPAASGAQSAIFAASSPKPLVVQTTPPPASVSVAGTNIPTASEAAPAAHPLGILAAATPNVLQVPQVVTMVSDAVQTARGVVSVTSHVAEHATNLLTSMLPAETLPGTAAYSFIHLDAGGFNDAVTAFANELATLSAPMAATHSSLRAWEITAAVIGADLIFFAWWYRKSRREREEKLAYVGSGWDPMPSPLT